MMLAGDVEYIMISMDVIELNWMGNGRCSSFTNTLKEQFIELYESFVN